MALQTDNISQIPHPFFKDPLRIVITGLIHRDIASESVHELVFL